MTNIYKLSKRLHTILNHKEKKSLSLLFFLTLVSSFVQATGMGAIFPFFLLIIEPEKLDSTPALLRMFEMSGIADKNVFVMAFGAVAISIFILGLGLRFLTEYCQLRYAAGRQLRFSVELFRLRVNLPYHLHLSSNSAETLARLASHTSILTNQFMMAVLKILSEIPTIILSLFVLLFVSPGIAVVLFAIIGVVYGVFHLATSKKIRALGEIVKVRSISNAKIINETISTFKELIIMQRSHRQVATYTESCSALIGAGLKYQTLAISPWYILQVIIIIVLFGVVVFMVGVKGDAKEAVALLGFYGLAMKQLLPSVTSVFSAIQATKQSEAVSTSLIEQLEECGDETSEAPLVPVDFGEKVSFKSVSYGYGESTDPAVFTDVNFEIAKNSFIGIVGKTGAGKTTLVDLFAGLLSPSSGRVCIDGADLDSATKPGWQSTIGYVPQAISLVDVTIAENIALGIPANEIDQTAVESAAKTAQIHEFITTELPNGYDTIVGERGSRLSGGQRQRIGIARALYSNPEIIILDEATSALDQQTESGFAKALDRIKAKHTVIAIAHRLTTLSHCDKFLFVADGTVQEFSELTDLPETDEDWENN